MIIVNLNGRVDYFGSTVNKASRIQSCAGANEIVFSADAAPTDSASDSLVQIYNGALREEQVKLKGINGDQTIYRLAMAASP